MSTAVDIDSYWEDIRPPKPAVQLAPPPQEPAYIKVEREHALRSNSPLRDIPISPRQLPELWPGYNRVIEAAARFREHPHLGRQRPVAFVLNTIPVIIYGEADDRRDAWVWRAIWVTPSGEEWAADERVDLFLLNRTDHGAEVLAGTLERVIHRLVQEVANRSVQEVSSQLVGMFQGR